MKNLFLYTTTVLIWGSTWLAIKFQLGSVDPMVSVTYRFTLASLLLLGYCKLFGLNLRFTLREHLFIALQGVLLFSINYWLVYLAEVHLTSGLVAVVFSTIVFMNIFTGALLLGASVRTNVLVGAAIGLVGIALVFWPELSVFNLSDQGFVGLLLGAVGTLSASFGNITSARNQRNNLPVIQTNAFGMGYGATLMFIFATVTGATFSFEASFAYVGSLFYLSVLGSILAFGAYLTLIGRIGPDKAAYSSMLFPLVALGISSLFEGYRWTEYALVGMTLILFGNYLALNKKRAPAPVQSEAVQ